MWWGRHPLPWGWPSMLQKPPWCMLLCPKQWGISDTSICCVLWVSSQLSFRGVEGYRQVSGCVWFDFLINRCIFRESRKVPSWRKKWIISFTNEPGSFLCFYQPKGFQICASSGGFVTPTCVVIHICSHKVKQLWTSRCHPQFIKKSLEWPNFWFLHTQ